MNQVEDGLEYTHKPRGFDKVVSSSFHYFSYAFESCYEQATYVRLVNAAWKVHCSWLILKFRVAPMKSTSVPKLELTAALWSIKMSALVKNCCLQILWNIAGLPQKSIKIFVAKWVQQIRENYNAPERFLKPKSSIFLKWQTNLKILLLYQKLVGL